LEILQVVPQNDFKKQEFMAYMLIITNNMQRNTIFFIALKALHVSGSFPTHHQEHKNCTYNISYFLSLVAAPTSVVEMEPL
jgi:hypothetical protein